MCQGINLNLSRFEEILRGITEDFNVGLGWMDQGDSCVMKTGGSCALVCRGLDTPENGNDMEEIIYNWVYCQTFNIRCTFVGSRIVDHSDVVGASPVGAAPTTSSFLSYLTLDFNGLGKDKCHMRWETFKFRDLVYLVLEIWQYMGSCIVNWRIVNSSSERVWCMEMLWRKSVQLSCVFAH